MSLGKSLLKAFGTIGLILALGVSMDACAGLSGGDTWKEEVLLHDGQKIIVERSQTYGGSREIGQPLPIKEHTIHFFLSGSSQAITWTSEYDEDLGRTNFNLLAVHALNGIPYVVASPNLCLSYNKWGRPNPPYVFFKYDGKDWQRIALKQFPAEFKTLNVAIYLGHQTVAEMTSLGLVTAEKINAWNSELTQPEYKIILREPLANIGRSCGEMVYDGHGGWTGIGWFRKQPSLEACLKFCERENVSAQFCPCETLFKGK